MRVDADAGSRVVAGRGAGVSEQRPYPRSWLGAASGSGLEGPPRLTPSPSGVGGAGEPRRFGGRRGLSDVPDSERRSTRSRRSASARFAQAPRRALADSRASRGLRCAPGRRRSPLALERLAAPLRPAFSGGLRGAAQTGGEEGESVRGFSRQARRGGSSWEQALRTGFRSALVLRTTLGTRELFSSARDRVHGRP